MNGKKENGKKKEEGEKDKVKEKVEEEEESNGDKVLITGKDDLDGRY